VRLDDTWVKTLLDTEELRSTHMFKLELETLDYKLEQLMIIVNRLRQLEGAELTTHIIDGKPTTTKFVLHREPEIMEWSGPTNIGGKKHNVYAGMDRLDYRIVTLTWRLYFPEHARAHIPTTRLAPRIGVHDDPR
jgi:hypothetical protein